MWGNLVWRDVVRDMVWSIDMARCDVMRHDTMIGVMCLVCYGVVRHGTMLRT